MNKKTLKSKSLIRLDIGCGGTKQGPDWLGIDYRKCPGVDIVHDITKAPYPLKNNSVSIACASHVLEHISKENFKLMKVFNEIWRLLIDGGEWIISLPYAGSPGYYQDPTHVSPITEHTFLYFTPLDQMTQGKLYSIYRPLPWDIKIMTWNTVGNLECVLRKLPIQKEYEVDNMWLKELKKNSK